MSAKAKKIDDCAMLFEIEVPKETLDKAFLEVYIEISKVANIPGFRPGKAPRELVEKHYAKDADAEVLKRVIGESYRMALKEHGVSPIGLPEISEVVFQRGKQLTFKAHIETRPKLNLKDYKGIKVEKRIVAIKDEDVDKTLQSLRERSAKYVAVEDRPAGMGDYVVSDLECFVDGKPIHQKRKNLWLFLDNEAVVPGLPAGIVGMKPGEERDIEVKLPENYPDKTAAAKFAKYHVCAREIKSRRLPDADDGFAKDLGRDNLEDLRKAINSELSARASVNAQIDMENRLLKTLADDNAFKVPKGLVKRQVELMVEDAKRRLVEKGFKKEDLDKKDKEFEEKFKDDAARQVRLLFILDEIARGENIDVSEKEIEEAYRTIAAETGKTETEVKEYYEKEGLIDSLAQRLREGKTIKFLIEKAEVVEKK